MPERCKKLSWLVHDPWPVVVLIQANKILQVDVEDATPQLLQVDKSWNF